MFYIYFFRISIHLMLRFNFMCCCVWHQRILISIHLMLRFNIKSWIVWALFAEFQYILCYGSTRGYEYVKRFWSIFQYILCYGSTARCDLKARRRNNFNTSYVTVQHYRTYHKGQNTQISIHLMLRFNIFFGY